MSHNVVLGGVKIKNLDLLNRAIKNLKIEGVTLDKTAKTFRTYRGQDPTCVARINLPGSYDIGLLKASDGTYNMVADFSMLGHTLQHADDKRYSAEAKVSRLAMEYGLVQAEYEAAQRGLTSTRIKGKDGHVLLECYAN